MISTHLIQLAQIMASHTGRSEATLSNKAAGNATLFERLRDGKGCNILTAEKVLEWFAANWPEDLEWPHDMPRPPKKKDAA
jgi:hypothetical protein